MNYSFATGIILAAGKGTRMKSDLPKCAHRLVGIPMVNHVGNALKECGISNLICIVGHESEKLTECLDSSYHVSHQDKQLGTGHAVMMTKEILQNHKGPIIIVPGDAPLIEGSLLQTLLEKHTNEKNDLTLATCKIENPKGYGRILRDNNFFLKKIVEEKDASLEIKKIKEVSSGIYCVNGEYLFNLLDQVENKNNQEEYYLTDIIEIGYKKKLKMSTLIFEDASMLYGVNDRYQLAQASRILYDRILKKHALNGVTIIDPLTTYIDQDVIIELDTVIHPMTTLTGNTHIQAKCQIGPFTKIHESKIGSCTEILMSNVSNSQIMNDCKVGPYANVRPESVVCCRSKIGNFVEIKKSYLDEGVSVGHLAYIGDASIGKNTNIGAGTITCNYDGFSKHKTKIEDDCFIGSNSTLIAPLTIKKRAIIAAGSVITKEVPEDSLGIGRGVQENKQEWAKKWREAKKNIRI